MKKWIMIWCICLLSACSGAGKQGYERMDASQAKEKMGEGAVVLDVRTSEEYAQGHIEGALNVPLDQIDTIDSLVSDKDQSILVYCRSGNRSAKAAARLVELQYTKVFDFGGIQDWPYDIVK